MQVKSTELGLGEIEKIAKSMPNLLQLTLTGGEPSLRRDLAKIPGIFSRVSRLAKCTVVTNGMLPERILEMVKVMVSDSPEVDFRLSVSMDDVGEKHDRIRGVEGSFEKMSQTVRLLCGLRDVVHNLWVDVSTTISKYNYHRFKEIHDWVKENFDVDNHMFAYSRGKTKEKDAKDIPPDFYAQVKRVVRDSDLKSDHVMQGPTNVVRELVRDEVEREIRENTFHSYCTAGRKFIEIYQDGRVAPCEILETMIPQAETIMGNLRDFDFNMADLLKSPQARKVVRLIRETKCHCTFECPKHMDILYSRQYYPRLARGIANQVLGRL